MKETKITEQEMQYVLTDMLVLVNANKDLTQALSEVKKNRKQVKRLLSDSIIINEASRSMTEVLKKIYSRMTEVN